MGAQKNLAVALQYKCFHKEFPPLSQRFASRYKCFHNPARD